jgi:hypothetical protein
MEYSMGEMGGCEFATIPLVLVDRGCVARTVADTGDSQQVRCRLRQEHRTEKGAVPYEFQLFASPRTPDDMEYDLFPALGLLNGGNPTEF